MRGVEMSLQLLMNDGMARVRFQPQLNAEQYSELLERVERSTTRDELRKDLSAAAKAWGSQFFFDSVLE